MSVERVLVIAENSESMDAIVLAGEARRLRRMESQVVAALEAKKQSLWEVRESINLCRVNGWDEGLERLDHEEARVLGEIALLEKVLND
jgi:hypothetical protein